MRLPLHNVAAAPRRTATATSDRPAAMAGDCFFVFVFVLFFLHRARRTRGVDGEPERERERGGSGRNRFQSKPNGDDGEQTSIKTPWSRSGDRLISRAPKQWNQLDYSVGRVASAASC